MESRNSGNGSSEPTRARFHKGTFEKIDPDRRARILEVAKVEFAAKGYQAASMNRIVQLSDISMGSMYSYFASKEDLFLTVVDSGYLVLEEALAKAEAESVRDAAGRIDPYSLFERLLREARDYARSYPEFNQIYLDAATQGLSSLSGKLSRRLETITADLYRRALAAGVEAGTVRRDVDEGAVAFYLDNLLVSVQLAFSSDYYHERLRIFTGRSALDDDGEALIHSLVVLVRASLAPPQ